MQLGSTSAAADAPAASTSAAADAAYNASILAFKAKDYPVAEAKLREAVGHDPDLRQAWGALGSACLEQGRNQEAAAAAEKAIALGSTDEAVFMSRWQAYKNLGDEAKAAEALKDLEATGRRTEEAKRIHNEAVALVKAGDDAGAFAKFQEALLLDPNLQESLLGLGTAGVKIGRNAEAPAAAETILKANPGNEKALRIRYNACLKLGAEEKLLDSLVGLAPVEPKIARDGVLKLAFLLAPHAFADPAAYSAFLRHAAAAEEFPIPGTPLRGLQVLGLLETRGLSFDTVFLLNATDDVIPGRRSHDLLLPQPLREQLGLETSRDRERLVEYYFNTLLAGAREVHCYYTESGNHEKSRSLEKLLWEEQKKNKNPDVSKLVQVVRYMFNCQ